MAMMAEAEAQEALHAQAAVEAEEGPAYYGAMPLTALQVKVVVHKQFEVFFNHLLVRFRLTEYQPRRLRSCRRAIIIR